MLSSESSSGRTSSRRASTERASAGQGDGQLAGPGRRDDQVVAVDADAADRVELEQRGGQAVGWRPCGRGRGGAGRPWRRGWRGGRRRRPAGRGRSTIWRSASRSTSCSTCELTMTVRPSLPSRRKRAMRWARCTGSAPLRGSSRTSTAGSVTRAAATFVRWRMPLLKPPTRRSATSSSPTVVQRAVDGGRVVDAVEVGDVADQLAGGQHRRARPRPRAPAPAALHLAVASGGRAR